MNGNKNIDAAHRIRLHGPWQVTVISADCECDWVQSKQIIPGDWSEIGGPNFRGTMSYLRKFNGPTGLTNESTVCLVIEEVDFAATCWLNEHSLGKAAFGTGHASFDITKLLVRHNKLRIDVRLSKEDACCPLRAQRAGKAGGLIGSVYLKIA